MCKETKCDVLCIQETHRTEVMKTPKIIGMKHVTSAYFTEENDIEILTIEMDKCTVTSIYKPPNAQFTFKKPPNFDAQKINFVIGDFNNHHTSWGYEETDENGHGVKKLRLPKPKIKRRKENENMGLGGTFLDIELEAAIKTLKNGKAAGRDDMCTEQIRHFGNRTKRWLLDLFNNIRDTLKLPKVWRKSKIIALLKPGKNPDLPSSYRPVSLLCHTYKLYERILLNRLGPAIDEKLVKEQAGFRPDDAAIAVQDNNFETIEEKLTNVLEHTSKYYTSNHLKPNPNKTLFCAFHLRNREANRKLEITWEEDIKGWIEPAEHLPSGHELQWHVWKTLNQLRVGVGRSKDNMLKWGYLNDQETSCHCGTIQTMAHLLVCPLAPGLCTLEDLTNANQKAMDVAQYWANENI
ncbi:hypothetical protein QTP88_026918 [Uroleucon formosanum]